MWYQMQCKYREKKRIKNHFSRLMKIRREERKRERKRAKERETAREREKQAETGTETEYTLE